MTTTARHTTTALRHAARRTPARIRAARPARARHRIALVLVPALVAAVFLGALASPPAHANRTLEVGMQDDRLLLGQDAARYFDRFKSFGVDRLRVMVVWRRVAPKPNSRSKPAGFDASDPAAYGGGWARAGFDSFARAARARGFKVLMTITGPAPRWATGGKRANGVYRPDAREFGRFAEAVARRYGDSVDQYSLWNEPNQAGWLQPQSTCSGRRCTPEAPHMYRRLVQAAYPAVKGADPTATVLIGNTAPEGREFLGPDDPLKPITFLRALACVDKRFRPVRSGPCEGFKPVTGDGYAHHPYGQLRRWGYRSPDPDIATFNDTGRLLKTLDRLTRARRLKVGGGGRFSLYFTELGFETRPPDPFNGYSPAQQKRWNQEVAYRAWANPRVKALFQYEYRDEPPVDGESGRSRWGSWQSGLTYRNGRKKPAYNAFPNPFYVTDAHPSRGRRVTFWGQVRPGAGHRVTLQARKGGSWRDIATVRTTGRGYFTVKRAVTASASFRFTWDQDGRARASTAVPVRLR